MKRSDFVEAGREGGRKSAGLLTKQQRIEKGAGSREGQRESTET